VVNVDGRSYGENDAVERNAVAVRVWCELFCAQFHAKVSQPHNIRIHDGGVCLHFLGEDEWVYATPTPFDEIFRDLMVSVIRGLRSSVDQSLKGIAKLERSLAPAQLKPE
jgi:hypothetical protein